MNDHQANPAVARLPLWWLWVGFSLLSVALGTWIRLAAPGWMLIILGIVFCGCVLAHPIIHGIGALRAGRHRLVMPVLLLLSDLFFILGMGFQVDYGDAPGAYMGFQVFAHQILSGSADVPTIPEGMDGLYLGLAVGSEIALVASWVAILILAFTKPKLRTAETVMNANAG